MKIALFQFAVSRNQPDNHRKILNAISDAADNGAKVIGISTRLEELDIKKSG